ncbi:MAG: hypothetical protein IJT44_11635 [Clostridia bacterium]|nr:hypothetical protein [Clostridia bacterium]
MKGNGVPVCSIRYCHREPASWFLAGFALLEQEGVLRIDGVERYDSFLKDDLYAHNSIIEVRMHDKLIVFDYETGMQSQLRLEHFDEQLQNVSEYFKTNFRPDDFCMLANRDKLHPFVPGAFFATVPGNPYDRVRLRDFPMTGQGMRDYLYYVKHRAEHVREMDYRNMLFDEHFSSYRILFWARLFGGRPSTAEEIRQTYPFLTTEQAEKVAQRNFRMLQECDAERIETCATLKKEFGDRFIGGLRDDAYARRVCPSLIAQDDCVRSRGAYHATMRSNVIGIATRGHHECVEAKFGEMLAAGRAIISPPVTCVMPGGFSEGKNYAGFTDMDTLCTEVERLLRDTQAVNAMEEENARFFREYMAPRECVLEALQTVFPNDSRIQSAKRKAVNK